MMPYDCMILCLASILFNFVCSASISAKVFVISRSKKIAFDWKKFLIPVGGFILFYLPPVVEFGR